MSVDDLWPNFDDVPDIVTPQTILKEQANLLALKTGNLVTAEVRTISNYGVDADKFYTEFSLTAPILKNYSYELFYMINDIFNYPVIIKFNELKLDITDEEMFRNTLKDILGSSHTRKIVHALIQRSREDRQENPFNL